MELIIIGYNMYSNVKSLVTVGGLKSEIIKFFTGPNARQGPVSDFIFFICKFMTLK